jgi:uncharacterized protein YdaU (DUF1376 family)
MGGGVNYYERHLGDYARDTAHLTMLEHGAYGLLLDRYYATEHGIPADQAHRIARARTRDERSAVDAVLTEFFTLCDGIWTHGRVRREIEKAQTKIKAARENGLRGGRPKQNPQRTDEKPTGFFVGSSLETQEKALQTPDTIHQKEKYPPPSGAPLADARPKSRGLRLPPGWSPGDDGLAFAEGQGLRNGMAAKELDRFRDYWAAQPGQKGIKTDWSATWRNWVRKAAESAPRSSAKDDVFSGAH